MKYVTAGKFLWPSVIKMSLRYEKIDKYLIHDIAWKRYKIQRKHLPLWEGASCTNIGNRVTHLARNIHSYYMWWCGSVNWQIREVNKNLTKKHTESFPWMVKNVLKNCNLCGVTTCHENIILRIWSERWDESRHPHFLETKYFLIHHIHQRSVNCRKFSNVHDTDWKSLPQ